MGGDDEGVLPLCRLGAAPLTRLMRAREVSAREVVTAFLERIDVVNPHRNAIVSRRPDDDVLRDADAADAALLTGEDVGPLSPGWAPSAATWGWSLAPSGSANRPWPSWRVPVWSSSPTSRRSTGHACGGRADQPMARPRPAGGGRALPPGHREA